MVTDMTWQEFSSLYYKQVVEMAHKYLHKMKSQSGFWDRRIDEDILCENAAIDALESGYNKFDSDRGKTHIEYMSRIIHNNVVDELEKEQKSLSMLGDLSDRDEAYYTFKGIVPRIPEMDMDNLKKCLYEAIKQLSPIDQCILGCFLANPKTFVAESMKKLNVSANIISVRKKRALEQLPKLMKMNKTDYHDMYTGGFGFGFLQAERKESKYINRIDTQFDLDSTVFALWNILGAEIIKLKIHNDNSCGSKNTFDRKQLSLFDNIMDAIWRYSVLLPPNNDAAAFISRAVDVPIYLIPYNILYEKMKSRCNSSFAKKMREKYAAEREASPNDKRLRKKYSRWICESFPKCEECIRKLVTPLGYFDPEQERIYICLDEIIAKYKEKTSYIAAQVILHELGHALMHNSKHKTYESLFEYWVEEALANKIALNYLYLASIRLGMNKLFEESKNFVNNQSDGYKFGIFLFEHNLGNSVVLRDNKTNINERIGDQWVDLDCEDNPAPLEVQRLFYRAFEQIVTHPSSSGFEAWMIKKGKSKSVAKRYSAITTSPYFGIVFKEMIGWTYNTLEDCREIRDLQKLIDAVNVKDSEEELFNYGTYGALKPVLNHYRDYLESLSTGPGGTK